MTLSDYERRVLNEIEVELAQIHASRWSKFGAVLRGNAVRLAVTAAGLAICVLLAVFASGPAAAVLGVLAGCAVGLAWGRPNSRTRRPRSRPRRRPTG